MPFSDLAHLEKSNLERGLLKYNRTKTGTPMSIEVLESAQNAIGGLYNKSDARSSGYPDYLFRILSGAYKLSLIHISKIRLREMSNLITK